MTERTQVVLVRPHYPENVGAAARAMKVMGLARLTLVRPSSLAVPEHAMAQKMAVKSLDVLQGSRRCSTISEAVEGCELVFATTARRGFSGALTARQAAREACQHAAQGASLAILFGNEKTGLTAEEHAEAQRWVRIPMAADQPSVNLAQAVQVLCYELFVAGLEARER